MSAQSESAQPRPHGVFATTHWSVVLQAGRVDSPDADAALEALCRSYWPAVHRYLLRTGRPPEVARDLTQAFFARLLAKGSIGLADPAKGRFRTFLLTLLHRFLADDYHRANAAKRGGRELTLSLESLMEEEESWTEPSPGRTPEQEFDRRWALATLENARVRLRDEVGRTENLPLLTALEDHLGGGHPERTLEEIGREFGLTEAATKMRLSRWRARYRDLIREEVACTVPAQADVDAELQHLVTALGT